MHFLMCCTGGARARAPARQSGIDTRNNVCVNVYINICVCSCVNVCLFMRNWRKKTTFSLCVCVFVCLCACVHEMEKDGQISVGDSHRGAASSPLTQSPESPQPIRRCDAAAFSLSFCLERQSRMLRLRVCACMCVCVYVCVCVWEDIIWKNANAGILSETVCVCMSVFCLRVNPRVCVWDNVHENLRLYLCVCVCQSSVVLWWESVWVRLCACVCAPASYTVHTNYISECVSGRNGHCCGSSSEE